MCSLKEEIDFLMSSRTMSLKYNRFLKLSSAPCDSMIKSMIYVSTNDGKSVGQTKKMSEVSTLFMFHQMPGYK